MITTSTVSHCYAHVSVYLQAGKLPCGAAVHPHRSKVNTVLSTNLQSLGLPRGTQHGTQVTSLK